jgi:hypothetical protein
VEGWVSKPLALPWEEYRARAAKSGGLEALFRRPGSSRY